VIAKPEFLKIRLATIDDFPEIVRIDKPFGLGQRQPFFRASILNNQCYVCSQDERIVAFAILEAQRFFGNDFITLIVVDSDFRRMGIARRLLGELIGQEGTKKLFTSTNSSNCAMRELLESNGWSLSGSLDGLDDGDPERIYFFDRRVTAQNS
jgi:ribosomal protein S18 acetylase RimI-like enzyme